MGALGGHLGLWIGMSAISFVEIFELVGSLFGVCAHALCSKQNKEIRDGEEDPQFSEKKANI